HLATCAACRADVEMAGLARVALAGLPELAAPGLAAEVLAAMEPRGPVSLAERRAARAPRWQRAAIGAGLAAAAVLAAIFVVRGSGPINEAASGGAPPRPQARVAAPGTTIIRSGVDYSAASLDALARSLAANDAADATSGALKAAPTMTKFGQQAGLDRNPADVQAAFECLQRGTGLAISD